MKPKWMLVLLAGAGLFWQCGSGPAPDLAPGMWRGVLTLPGGELPFQMQFTRQSGEWQGVVINGEERVLLPDIEITGERVRLEMPAFNSTFDAMPASVGNGEIRSLAGTLTLIKSGAKPQVMPFHAQAGNAFRFSPESTEARVNISGRWSVTFREDDGSETAAVGEFRQQGAALEGTFMTLTGDYRFLAGEVRGDSLYLSCFDGGHAFLFKAVAGSDGELSGDFWSGTAWHESWTARRDDSAALPDPYELTYLKPGYDRFTFRFPSLDSSLVSLDEPAYRGKVVIVQIAGSWCPNCHDETAFLSPFYRENRYRGLEIIALMFERYGDFDRAAHQVSRFREHFDIQYETLIAGTSLKSEASAALPMLNHVLSYPTTIFVDRRGSVRRIHTGFTGPGTGIHYETLTREFREFVDMLLAE